MTRGRLEGKVVAITGAARGIGLATAKALVAAGARVGLGDVDGELARQEARSIGALASGFEVDVTDESSFRAFVASIEAALGPVDVLINNAGIMPIGPFVDESGDLASKILDVNVLGPLLGMKAVLPAMRRRGSGHIVNVASAAGRAPVPGGITYAASKAAVISLTESARVEFADSGVDFTCVLPSFTNTQLIVGTSGAQGMRTVEPEEVADAIVRGLERSKPDVFVPASLGPILKFVSLLGRSIRDALYRRSGSYRLFLDFDSKKRAEYDARIDRPR